MDRSAAVSSAPSSALYVPSTPSSVSEMIDKNRLCSQLISSLSILSSPLSILSSLSLFLCQSGIAGSMDISLRRAWGWGSSNPIPLHPNITGSRIKHLITDLLIFKYDRALRDRLGSHLYHTILKIKVIAILSLYWKLKYQ